MNTVYDIITDRIIAMLEPQPKIRNDMNTLSKIKTIRSHVGYFRFLAECSDAVGEIPRCIKTPYASSPTHMVFEHGEKFVIFAETSHRCFEVHEVLNFQPLATI